MHASLIGSSIGLSLITNLWIQCMFCIFLTSAIWFLSNCSNSLKALAFSSVLYWPNKSNFQTLLQNPYLPEKLSRTMIEQKQKTKGNNLEPAVCGIYQPTKALIHKINYNCMNWSYGYFIMRRIGHLWQMLIPSFGNAKLKR